jgi:hypothetical protein
MNNVDRYMSFGSQRTNGYNRTPLQYNNTTIFHALNNLKFLLFEAMFSLARLYKKLFNYCLQFWEHKDRL